MRSVSGFVKKNVSPVHIYLISFYASFNDPSSIGT